MLGDGRSGGGRVGVVEKVMDRVGEVGEVWGVDGGEEAEWEVVGGEVGVGVVNVGVGGGVL